jgi:hypothetical protein
MGSWFRGMFKSRQAARPAAPAPPSAMPGERAGDPQAGADREFQDLVKSAGAAFTEMVVKNGCYFPGDSSTSLDDIRERLRGGRCDRW